MISLATTVFLTKLTLAAFVPTTACVGTVTLMSSMKNLDLEATSPSNLIFTSPLASVIFTV